MTDESMITVESSKEDVANYFSKKFSLKEEVKNNLLKEDISADVLYDLDENDFKQLGIKLGPLKKMKTFLKDNKDKFEEKKIEEKITAISKPEEVSSFFEKCLDFKGDLNNLDGKGLIELNEEGIKKLGLNIGQKKKIVKYINYFKTLKVEPPEETEMKITKESSQDEISKYFKEILNLSDSAINALELDGESLFSLEDSDIDGVDELTKEEKEKLKNFLKEIKEKNQNSQESPQEIEIILTNESKKEEVDKYLKEKLKLSDKAIEALELDGETLFSLEESDIDQTDDLSQEEKDILKNFIKELKDKNQKNKEPEIIITNKSNKDEVAKFLKEKLKFSDKAIESLELEGETLFSLEEKEIDDVEELTQEEKDNLKKFLNEEKEKRQKEKSIEENGKPEEISQKVEEVKNDERPAENVELKVDNKNSKKEEKEKKDEEKEKIEKKENINEEKEKEKHEIVMMEEKGKKVEDEEKEKKKIKEEKNKDKDKENNKD